MLHTFGECGQFYWRRAWHAVFRWSTTAAFAYNRVNTPLVKYITEILDAISPAVDALFFCKYASGFTFTAEPVADEFESVQLVVGILDQLVGDNANPRR